MENLLAWCLAVFGFTYIVVFSKITKSIREWADNVSFDWFGELLHCPLCTGFWVGLLGHFLMFSPTGSFLFDMCLGSIVSWTGTLVIYQKQLQYETGGTKPCSNCGGQLNG